MSKVLCEKSDLVAIADSIRSKTGSTDGMKVAEIPQKIEAIETGSNINIQASKSVTITANGTATITPDAGYDGLGSVDVTVNVASGGGGGQIAPHLSNLGGRAGGQGRGQALLSRHRQALQGGHRPHHTVGLDTGRCTCFVYRHRRVARRDAG